MKTFKCAHDLVPELLTQYCKNQSLCLVALGGLTSREAKRATVGKLQSDGSRFPWYLSFLRLFPSNEAVFELPPAEIMGLVDELHAERFEVYFKDSPAKLIVDFNVMSPDFAMIQVPLQSLGAVTGLELGLTELDDGVQ